MCVVCLGVFDSVFGCLFVGVCGCLFARAFVRVVLA